MQYQKEMVWGVYRDVLREKGTLKLQLDSFGHEICALYQDATLFYRSIRQRFQTLMTQKENRIERIKTLAHQTPSHREESARLEEELESLREIFAKCLD